MADNGNDKSPIRVLYMHGMNSGPGSHKPTVLARHFATVYTPAMHLSEQARAARVQLALAWLLCVLSSFVLSRRLRRLGRWGRVAVSLLAGSVCAAFGYLPMKHRTVRNMLAGGVKEQKRAIGTFQPQVVVASSFGGAIALECIRKGLWRGPTVLLAPATSLVARGMGPKGDLFAQRLATMRIDDMPDYCRLHLVHGMADETVPVSDTLELAASLSGDTLPEVKIGETDLSDGQGRLLLTLSEADGHELVTATRNTLPGVIRRLSAPSTSGDPR
mmetsp:Transcript_10688/g.43807  ORF Transcript_10688/g.43807 Transcript_10688/m.43807 type:complete len:274 (+) Transcript_10688:357-1178(+)